MTSIHIPLVSCPLKLSFPVRHIRRINSNLFIGKSNTDSKELSIILARNTDKSADSSVVFNLATWRSPGGNQKFLKRGGERGGELYIT
jgi:hypothetical protein